nr:hypothetical protein [Tanacetum cinerariifolium]
MVQAPEEVCDILTDTQDIPILTQPSSSQPPRKHKPRRKQREATEVPYTEPQAEERVPTPSYDPLPSEVKEKSKKLEEKKKRTHGLNRLYKVGLSARVESSKDEEDQRRIKDQDLFGVHDLDGDEVFVDVTTGEDVEHDATVAKNVEGIATAITPQISKDELTLAQTLMEIKDAKPKAKGVTIQEPSEFRTTSHPQPSQPPQAKDKGKGIIVEPEKPLKKKDQIAFDEEVARKLEAKMKDEMDEEERITREKNEANKAIIEE